MCACARARERASERLERFSLHLCCGTSQNKEQNSPDVEAKCVVGTLSQVSYLMEEADPRSERDSSVNICSSWGGIESRGTVAQRVRQKLELV